MQLDLRMEREQRNWSRARLARELGTSEHHIAQWEDGLTQPSPLFQQALAVLFERPEAIMDATPLRARRQELTFLLLPSPTMPKTPRTKQPIWSQSAEIFMQGQLHDPILPDPFLSSHDLIGRTRLLPQLKQHLVAHHNLALYGLPGVGKTALALALAHDQDIRNLFSDGILWADLGLHSHIPGILRRWSTLIGIPSLEEEAQGNSLAWMQTLRNTLQPLRLLVILDDVWQSEDVEQVQIAGPECGYIITTRFAHIATRLASNAAIRIPELEVDDGVQLLTRYVPETSQEEEHSTALALVRAVGGLPLALTLMSKYLGSNAYTRQPRRLHAAFTHLQDAERRLYLHVPPSLTEPSSTPEPELSLASVIAVSDLHLPPQARKALRSLALLPPKPTYISRAAALAVTGASLDTLTTLCDAGLLDQPNVEYYTLHALIADYARTQGIETEHVLSLIQYGARFIEEHRDDAPALETESEILFAALEHAWEQKRYSEFIHSCHILLPFLLRWGWYSQAEQLLQKISLVVTQYDQQRDPIQSLEHLSTLADLQDNYSQAWQYSSEELILAHQEGNQEQVMSQLAILKRLQERYIE
jgi:transcriptional regulator with XRE-family HTH domain